MVRRRWMPREKFLDLLGAANLIPGPTSTELALHLGYARAGWAGLWIAGFSFILPSFLLVLGLAWAYVRFGFRPEVAGVLYGLKPLVAALLLQALWRLGRGAIKNGKLAWIAGLAWAAAAAGVSPLGVLLGAGILAAIPKPRVDALAVFSPGLGERGAGPMALLFFGGTAVPLSAPAIFLFFLKVGAWLFGSGYLLFAFLKSDLVDRLHWLSDRQLLDAIAMGSSLPDRFPPRLPSSAIFWPGGRAPWPLPWAFFYRPSSWWPSAVGWCRRFVPAPGRAPFWRA